LAARSFPRQLSQKEYPITDMFMHLRLFILPTIQVYEH